MQAGGDIHAGLDCLDDFGNPMVRQYAACIHNADHKCACACGGRFIDCHICQTGVGLAAVEAHLTDAPVRAPVDNTLCGLGRQLVMNITEKQEVGALDFHVSHSSVNGVFCGS